MAITSNLGMAKRGGRLSFSIDEPLLREKFFGFTQFEFGDDPNGPLMAVQVIPPDLDFVTHFHHTDYCTLVLDGALQVGRTWYRAGDFRVQDEGSVYGPIRTGPEGCTIVSFYGDRSALSDQFVRQSDRERYDALMPGIIAAFVAAGIGGAEPPSRQATP